MNFFNKMATTSMVAMVSSGLFLSGCATNAQSGAGLGALGGGLIGSLAGPSKNREQNALIGAAVGGLLGYAVGNEMDKEDLAHVNQAYENIPDNQSVAWVNPNTRNKYTVTPRSTTKNQYGRDCRQAEIDSVIEGKHETVVKMACRRPDGQWDL